jgi:hypothetical protein
MKNPWTKIAAIKAASWPRKAIYTNDSQDTGSGKARILADGLYENSTVALKNYPSLAGRRGCEPVENAFEREMDKRRS